MIRSTVADVDLDAIAHNFRAIRDFLDEPVNLGKSSPGIVAVVKANAYGHGAGPVALAL
jgi:alanine racemase